MILFFRGLRDYPTALEKTSVCMFWKLVVFTLLTARLIAQPVISGGARPCCGCSFVSVCTRCVWVRRPFGLSGQGDCFYRTEKKPQRLKWRTFDLRSVVPPYCFSLRCCRIKVFSPCFLIRYFLYSVCAKYG